MPSHRRRDRSPSDEDRENGRNRHSGERKGKKRRDRSISRGRHIGKKKSRNRESPRRDAKVSHGHHSRSRERSRSGARERVYKEASPRRRAFSPKRKRRQAGRSTGRDTRSSHSRSSERFTPPPRAKTRKGSPKNGTPRRRRGASLHGSPVQGDTSSDGGSPIRRRRPLRDKTNVIVSDESSPTRFPTPLEPTVEIIIPPPQKTPELPKTTTIDKNKNSNESSKTNEGQDKTVVQEDIDANIQEDILEILGENPTASKKAKININASVRARWEFWCRSGVPEKEWEELLKIYEPEGVFKAADLNPEVRATLKDTQIKRDGYYTKYQNLIGAALNSLGAAISLVIEEKEEPVDATDLVKFIFDAGKLLSEVHHNQTLARRAFIEPGLSKETTDVLKTTTTDTLLYGTDLSTKISQSKTLSRTAKAMKLNTFTRFNPAKNMRGVQRRPITWTRRPSNTFGQARQQPFFRDRRQFNNQKTYFNPKFKPNRAPPKK